MSTANEWNVDELPTGPIAMGLQLPDIVGAEQFLNETLEMPTELVSGLIHRNTLTMFSGGSKTFKTFVQLDLGLSVSQGLSWWGRQVSQGRVLFVNFEIAPAFFQRRLSTLADAKGLERPIKDFDVWNLRGFATDARNLVPKIIDRCKRENYSMIILDPSYKLMADRSENAANEMAEFLGYFEQLSNETGAAVSYTHHFAKGLAAGKDHIDRASGSGVFARHADGIITLTAHEEENAFTFEATFRNFPPLKPFVLRWEYPLMLPDYDADPKKLKNKPGAKPKYTVADILECLTDGMTTGEWERVAIGQLGLVHSTFANLKRQAEAEERLEQKDKGWFRKPKILSYTPLTGESEIRDAGATRAAAA
jgi:regulatory protein RepA